MAQPTQTVVLVVGGAQGGDSERNMGTMIHPTGTAMPIGGPNVNSVIDIHDIARPTDWRSGQKAENGIVVGTMAPRVEPKQTGLRSRRWWRVDE